MQWLPTSPSAASQSHPRLPTRPSHPAGRASTGSPLLDAHSGSGSTCRTSSGSSSAPGARRGATTTRATRARRAARNLGARCFWPSSYVTRGGLRSLGRLVRRLPVAQAARMAKSAHTISDAGQEGGATQAHDGGSHTLCELSIMRASRVREGEVSHLTCCRALCDVLVDDEVAHRRWTRPQGGHCEGFKPSLAHQCPRG